MGERNLPSIIKDRQRLSTERRKTNVILPPIKQKMKQRMPFNCSTMKRYNEIIEDSYNEVLRGMQSQILYRAAKRNKHKRPSFWKYKDKLGKIDVIDNQFRGPPHEAIWLRIVRCVVLMISAYSAMTKPFEKTEKISEKSINREFQIRIDLRQSLHFNPSFFSRIKETVPKMCVLVMNKPNTIRSYNDITLVYNLMMDMNIFHTKYTQEMCWEMAKYLRYQKFKTKKILTKAHRKPLSVYFLYSGQVNLFYSVEGDEDLMTAKSRNILLKPGALLGANKKTWLCICASDCEFLTMDKEIFETKGFAEVVKHDEEEKFTFFRNWPPIYDWSDNACYDLAKASFIDNHLGNRLVLYSKHEEISDLIFFVVEGHVDVIKVIYVEQCRKMVIKPTESCTFKQAKERRKQFHESIASGLRRSTNPSLLCEVEEVTDDNKISKESLDIHVVKDDHPMDETRHKGKPRYLKIHTLYPGDCYGLGKLKLESLPKDCGRFSLISRNSTVIRTPCKELMESIFTLGIDEDALNKSCFVFDSDEVLCSKAKESSRNEELIERIKYQYFPNYEPWGNVLKRRSSRRSRKDRSTISHVFWRDYI